MPYQDAARAGVDDLIDGVHAVGIDLGELLSPGRWYAHAPLGLGATAVTDRGYLGGRPIALKIAVTNRDPKHEVRQIVITVETPHEIVQPPEAPSIDALPAGKTRTTTVSLAIVGAGTGMVVVRLTARYKNGVYRSAQARAPIVVLRPALTFSPRIAHQGQVVTVTGGR